MELLTTLFFVILLINSALDWYNIKKRNREIRHGWELIVESLFYFLVTAFVLLTKKAELKETLFLIIPWPGVRWLIHDFVLNILRGLPAGYIDREEVSAFSDKVLAWFEDALGINQFIIKVVVIGIGVALAFFVNIKIL